MFQKDKGCYGYIQKRKLINVGLTLFFAICVSLMIIGANVWFPKDYKNISLVMGILLVLPGANFFVQLIVSLPYKDVDRAEYNRVKEASNDSLFYTNLNITASNLPTIPLSYVYVHPNGVIAATTSSKIDLKKSQDYIESMLRANGIDTMVKIYTNTDGFVKRMTELEEKNPVKKDAVSNKLQKTADTLLAISL